MRKNWKTGRQEDIVIKRKSGQYFYYFSTERVKSLIQVFVNFFYVLAEHMWTSNYRKEYDDYISIYEDQRGCEPLYGNMPSSNCIDYQLRSNQIGNDCYTKPHLCESGFSIGFDITGTKALVHSAIGILKYMHACMHTSTTCTGYPRCG